MSINLHASYCVRYLQSNTLLESVNYFMSYESSSRNQTWLVLNILRIFTYFILIIFIISLNLYIGLFCKTLFQFALTHWIRSISLIKDSLNDSSICCSYEGKSSYMLVVWKCNLRKFCAQICHAITMILKSLVSVFSSLYTVSYDITDLAACV